MFYSTEHVHQLKKSGDHSLVAVDCDSHFALTGVKEWPSFCFKKASIFEQICIASVFLRYTTLNDNFFLYLLPLSTTFELKYSSWVTLKRRFPFENRAVYFDRKFTINFFLFTQGFDFY